MISIARYFRDQQRIRIRDNATPNLGRTYKEVPNLIRVTIRIITSPSIQCVLMHMH